ncbi:hypothetical protein F2P45_15580 [Massilia sp. CCM 8733]|uniref:Methyl-accepting transducer domain-containing protein n=1 Tax=Massilia mucilaginosa TaxID=2609282 RepID=A0ABX0NU12_9BURK|nr:methyl-accepting chemotaxis protein [Massilia mucilaginosa]NHZ90429.1 hypothetical protein [Massilia mucilaginosa]
MKNPSIGTRLTLGFAVVLLFLVVLTGIGVWRMQQASVMTDNMVKQTVRNERLIDEWAKVIEVNAARTATAWKVSDPADQKKVEEQMKLASARATEIQTILGESVKHPRAKALLEQVLETRKAYTAARARVFKQLISDSVSKVDNGTRLVDQAGKTMEEVVTSINRVTRIMNDITSASDEQRDGIEQVNLAVTQMDQAAQQNAALVEQSAAAAAAMQEQATQLSQVVGVFKLGQMAAGRRELALLGR